RLPRRVLEDHPVEWLTAGRRRPRAERRMVGQHALHVIVGEDHPESRPGLVENRRLATEMLVEWIGIATHLGGEQLRHGWTTLLADDCRERRRRAIPCDGQRDVRPRRRGIR